MEEMSIRLATLEDKEHVLAIHDDVYEGLDYLPATFDHLLSCRNAKSYVGIVNGEIIAFAIAFVVDDGYTVITKAGRSNPKYTGKGFYSALQTHVVQHSRARENAFTAVDGNKATSTASFQRKYKRVVSKEMSRYLFTPRTVQIPEISQQSTLTNIRHTTDTDLELYMTSAQHRKYLFPDDVIIVNWVPYRLLPSNIPLIGVPGCTNMLTNVDAGDQKGLLSAATVYPSKDPPFTANLDIYGSDPQSIETHFAAQMEFLRSTTDSTLCLLVFVDTSLHGPAVEQGFGRFGLKTNIWRSSSNAEIEFSKQLLFRRSIEI